MLFPASGKLKLSGTRSVKLLLNGYSLLPTHQCYPLAKELQKLSKKVYSEQYMEIGSKLSSEPVPRIPPHILK